MSDSLWHHGLRNSRLPCPSLSPRVCSNSCPLTQRCHPTISFYIHMYFYINVSSEQNIWTDFIQQMWFQQIVPFIGNWPGSSPQIRFAFSEAGPSPGGVLWKVLPAHTQTWNEGNGKWMAPNRWRRASAWTLDSRTHPSKEQNFPLLQSTSNLFTNRKREGKEFPSKQSLKIQIFSCYNDYRKACQLTDFVFPRQNSIGTTSRAEHRQEFFFLVLQNHATMKMSNVAHPSWMLEKLRC